METETETIKKDADKKTIDPLFQRENTTKIDELIEWWKKLPNTHINMRKVTPPANYPKMDKEPILMYLNTPVLWLEYRAGAWYGFSHYLGGHKTKDPKFPRVHNINEQQDMIKHYIDPRKEEIEKAKQKDKNFQQKLANKKPTDTTKKP